MNVFGFLGTGVAQEERESLRRAAMRDNSQRGRIVAAAAIAFETAYALIGAVFFLLRQDRQFDLFCYLVLYALMITICIAFVIYINKNKNVYDSTPKKLARSDRVLFLFVTFFMVWGSAVTLLDQRLYGGLNAFMANMIVCSVIFVLDTRSLAFPFAISVLLLAAGLPFFQSSGQALAGHYIALSFFTVVSWIASRVLYKTYCNDFRCRSRLEETNRVLGEQVEENKAIQAKLSALNGLLTEMSLIDDLTKIPNRRSFRNFIETSFKHFSKEGVELSVMMADIDFFKNYNDKYGHIKGDEVLKAVASEIHASVGCTRDFAARWGGEEFVFVSYGERDAEKIAEDIRERVQNLQIAHAYSEACGFLTVSIGVCRRSIREKSEIHVIIDKADEAMYRAKEAGRNCVKVNR